VGPQDGAAQPGRESRPARGQTGPKHDGHATVAETTQFLRLSKSTVYALMDKGELRGRRVWRGQHLPDDGAQVRQVATRRRRDRQQARAAVLPTGDAQRLAGEVQHEVQRPAQRPRPGTPTGPTPGLYPARVRVATGKRCRTPAR